MRYAHKTRPEISEELRGWSWRQPPLLFPYENVRIAISEAYGTVCPSGRDLYLKHVLHKRPMTTKRQAEGYLIHHLLGKFTTCLRHHISSRDVSVSALYGKLLAEKPRLYQEWVTFLRYQELILERHESLFDIYFDELWVPMALEACSEYAKARMVNPYATEETILAKIAPVFSEFEVDGTPLGFSDICRLDYFTPFGIIVEVKTTYPDDMHRLAAAAYGLSVEASFEIPVDHALIQYIWMQSSGHLRVAQRLVPLTDSLRMRAVEVRDHRARILAEGIDPAPDERCTAECPFSGLAVNE
ncbi:MAG: type I-A CRISPR-associated protein Cas4/Csa1 [Nitrososphaerota archaeon]